MMLIECSVFRLGNLEIVHCDEFSVVRIGDNYITMDKESRLNRLLSDKNGTENTFVKLYRVCGPDVLRSTEQSIHVFNQEHKFKKTLHSSEGSCGFNDNIFTAKLTVNNEKYRYNVLVPEKFVKYFASTDKDPLDGEHAYIIEHDDKLYRIIYYEDEFLTLIILLEKDDIADTSDADSYVNIDEPTLNAFDDDDLYDRPFIDACKENNVVRLTFEELSNMPELTLFEGFYMACQHGSYNVVKYMMEDLPDNTQDRIVKTKNHLVFRIACMNGHKNIAEALLQKYSFIDVRQNDDEIIKNAIERKDKDLYELLCNSARDKNNLPKYDANIDQKDDNDKNNNIDQKDDHCMFREIVVNCCEKNNLEKYIKCYNDKPEITKQTAIECIDVIIESESNGILSWIINNCASDLNDQHKRDIFHYVCCKECLFTVDEFTDKLKVSNICELFSKEYEQFINNSNNAEVSCCYLALESIFKQVDKKHDIDKATDNSDNNNNTDTPDKIYTIPPSNTLEEYKKIKPEVDILIRLSKFGTLLYEACMENNKEIVDCLLSTFREHYDKKFPDVLETLLMFVPYSKYILLFVDTFPEKDLYASVSPAVFKLLIEQIKTHRDNDTCKIIKYFIDKNDRFYYDNKLDLDKLKIIPEKLIDCQSSDIINACSLGNLEKLKEIYSLAPDNFDESTLIESMITACANQWINVAVWFVENFSEFKDEYIIHKVFKEYCECDVEFLETAMSVFPSVDLYDMLKNDFGKLFSDDMYCYDEELAQYLVDKDYRFYDDAEHLCDYNSIEPNRKKECDKIIDSNTQNADFIVDKMNKLFADQLHDIEEEEGIKNYDREFIDFITEHKVEEYQKILDELKDLNGVGEIIKKLGIHIVKNKYYINKSTVEDPIKFGFLLNYAEFEYESIVIEDYSKAYYSLKFVTNVSNVRWYYPPQTVCRACEVDDHRKYKLVGIINGNPVFVYYEEHAIVDVMRKIDWESDE